MQQRTDRDIIEKTHNLARYFTEQRQVGWVLLVGTIIWGLIGYVWMPKAKDPTIPIRVAAAVCIWPGASAERIEQLVTKRMEAVIAENTNVETISSNTRSSVVVIYVLLKDGLPDVGKVFDDIALKLNTINDLPYGAGPIQFIKDFGDTAALMLTVASPKVGDVELDLRAATIQKKIEEVRASVPPTERRATILSTFPPDVDAQSFQRLASAIVPELEELGRARNFRFLEGSGFIGIDAEILDDSTDDQIRGALAQLIKNRTRLSEIHPDVWPFAVVRDPSETRAKLGEVAGDKYTYRQLDDYTDMIRRHLLAVPLVSKVSRSGVLPEQVYLEYSQNRLASLGIKLDELDKIIGARNIAMPGGVIEIDQKNITIDPSGQLKDVSELGEILVGASEGGLPIYLRDVVSIERSYESPPRFLNFITAQDPDGEWRRHRAITIAVQMRTGGQIEDFQKQVDATLATVTELLPEDLLLRRTSDQPLQVKENVGLFMRSLGEAIILVVLVALVGFWEWRSALLMAASIPVTLAMTFGMMALLGLDIQQVSVASLILALGLLVDDPVVAGDAIKRSLADGHKPIVAAWLGPTKLAAAILFATITNIVAYLPFLVLSGEVGQFLFALPVVMTCSLVASRIVSMTFIPMLGYYLLRPNKEPENVTDRSKGFAKYYTPLALWCLAHRKLVLLISLVPLVGGMVAGALTQPSFFPKDLAYMSYVEVWLPEDAPLAATREAAFKAEQVIRDTAGQYALDQGRRPEEIVESLTTFVGGGGPRFWYSVEPEQEQLNYAQILIQVKDKRDTLKLIAPLQDALADIPGAQIDVRELENGKPIGRPVAVRIKGEDVRQLRAIADQVKAVFREVPIAERIRDDWGSDSFSVKLQVDPDRANFAGVTNLDVALSSAIGMNGAPVGILREKNRQIPIVARMRSEERAQLEDVQNLYVHGRDGQKVPVRQVSRIAYSLETEKILRNNHFRTMTVSCYPAAGFLPSQVMTEAWDEIEAISATLPPGYKIEIGGEYEEQNRGFGELLLVLFISVAAIFMALTIQFKSAVKPVMVFASLPYGVAGAFATIYLTGTSFGFMAFLGIISLIGVIVSHIIVLFDLIEELREHGAPLKEALVDAAILRIRPVMITVGATVLGLVPLATNGGPLWQPLCYAQIGGLTIATALTLVLVPVLYAIFVQDLKWIDWPEKPAGVAPAMTMARRIPTGLTQHFQRPISAAGTSLVGLGSGHSSPAGGATVPLQVQPRSIHITDQKTQISAPPQFEWPPKPPKRGPDDE
jgi:multidrug efflux pump subunit AcrB